MTEEQTQRQRFGELYAPVLEEMKSHSSVAETFIDTERYRIYLTTLWANAVARPGADTIFLDDIGARVVTLDFGDDRAIEEAARGHDVAYNCLANTKMHQSLAQHREVEIGLTRRVIGGGGRYEAAV